MNSEEFQLQNVELKEIINEVSPITMENTMSKSSKTFRPQKKQDSVRYNKELDTYDNKPKDPEYFKKYWRTQNWFIECDNCGQQTPKLSLSRHKKSNRCKKLGDLRVV